MLQPSPARPGPWSGTLFDATDRPARDPAAARARSGRRLALTGRQPLARYARDAVHRSTSGMPAASSSLTAAVGEPRRPASRATGGSDARRPYAAPAARAAARRAAGRAARRPRRRRRADSARSAASIPSLDRGRCARARTRGASRRRPSRGPAASPARSPRPRRRRRRRGGRRARGRAGRRRDGPSARARSQRRRAPRSRCMQPQPQPARRAPTRRRRAGAALGGAVGRLGGEVDRAHVLVDARGVAVRRRALAVDARPVAHRAAGGLEVARLPERERQQPQHGGVVGLGVARVDQPLGGDRRSRPRPARAARRS